MAIITVANPGSGNDIKSSIDAAHTAASDFDTLLLPNGSFILSAACAFTKKISIQGGGIGVTNLTWASTGVISDNTLSNGYVRNGGYTPMFDFNINSDFPSRITVDGITFTSRNHLTSTAADTAILMTFALDFRIRNCRFEYFGYAAVKVQHKDYLAGGVIYNCQFYINAKGSAGLGLGYGVAVAGDDRKWMSRSDWGTSNFIFIEDCTFEQHRHTAASAGCGKYVFRYNTDLNNGVLKSIDEVTHSVDSHTTRNTGFGTQNNFSTRAIECYNNTISHTQYYDGTALPGSGIAYTTPALAGTVTNSAGGNTVTGVGTSFTTSFIGSDPVIRIGVENKTVSSITNNTSLTISGTWTNANSGAAYQRVYGLGDTVGYGLICRGGGAIYYNNTITGTSYGIGIYQDSTPFTTVRPLPYMAGWLGCLKYGASKSGTTIEQTDDDIWFWNNTVSSYSTMSVVVGSQTTQFVNNINYHTVTNPNYTAYKYPHPLRFV